VLCALQAVAGLGPRRPRRASELLTFRGRRAAGPRAPSAYSGRTPRRKTAAESVGLGDPVEVLES